MTLEEVFDAYVETGTEPPRWLAEKIGRAKRAAVTDDGELARLAGACGVPERYKWVAPDESRNDRLAAGVSLYVHGTSGDGKTTTACRILKGWLAAGMGTALFVPAMDLMDELRDTITGGASAATMRKYTGCGLLVVDDLGKGKMGVWTVSKLFQLFDTRYSAKLPTIVTTQHGTSKLARLMGSEDAETAQAIVSRMRETFKGIDCGDEDRRLSNGKA